MGLPPGLLGASPERRGQAGEEGVQVARRREDDLPGAVGESVDPQQVARILIREIDGPRNNAVRYGKAFRGLGTDVAATFREAGELASAVASLG